MADAKSITTTSTDSDALTKSASATVTNTNTNAAAAEPATQQPKSSWRDKLHLGSKKPEEVGKESWRDANLSEEQRWKEWNKAKDREQKNNGATGVFTQPYKAKGAGKWGYWLDAIW